MIDFGSPESTTALSPVTAVLFTSSTDNVANAGSISSLNQSRTCEGAVVSDALLQAQLSLASREPEQNSY